MLYYDRIDVSGGIDINKVSGSKECDICQYWYILACSGCHDLLVMSMNLPDIAVLDIKGTDYGSIISAKNEAINLMQNIDLTRKIVT